MYTFVNPNQPSLSFRFNLDDGELSGSPYRLYEWYRKVLPLRLLLPSEVAGMSVEFSPPSHIQIYCKDPVDMQGQSILIFGDGPSAIWLSCHFKTTNFVFITYKTKQDVEKNLSNVSKHLDSIGFNKKKFLNSVFTYAELDTFYENCFVKYECDKHGNLHLVLENISPSDKIGALCQQDMLCFSAIGFQPANDLDDCVSHGLERFTTTLLPRKFCKWNVAPELALEVPGGSLPDSFMMWHDETKTIGKFFDPGFYHLKNKWRLNQKKNGE